MRHLIVVAVIVGAACGQELESTEPSAEHSSAELFQDPFINKWTGGLVPICFSSLPAREVALVKDALAKSWAGVSNVGFVYSNSCPFPWVNTFVRFNFTPNVSDWGSSGVVDILGMTSSNTTVTFCAPGNASGCLPGGPMAADYEEAFRSVVIHEVGHVLGFRHEQQRPDATPSCPLANDGQSAIIPNGILLTPTYDADSVMNYCRGWDGVAPLPYQVGYRGADRLSAGDIEGVRVAYGPRLMSARSSPASVGKTPGSTFTISANDAFGAPVANGSVFFNGVRLGAVGQLLAAPTKTSTVCVWVPGSCDEGLCTKPHKECEPVTSVVPFTVEVRAAYFTSVNVSIGVVP